MSQTEAGAAIRPARLVEIGLVALGGALGTLARAALTSVPLGETPFAVSLYGILAVNGVGSFLMGLLVGWLSRRAPSRRLLAVRAGLGTGFLGGFTTFSAYAFYTTMWSMWVWPLALLLWVPIALCGVLALVGLRLGAGPRPGRGPTASESPVAPWGSEADA